MNIRHSSILLATLLVSVLFLTGCKSSLLVRNAGVEEIIPILEDYAGTHGYTITYRNDSTGAFRLSLGNFYVPERSETSKTKEITQFPPPEKSNLPFTAYEETTWRTVSNPGHYVEATAMVSLTQQNKDVLVVIDTNNVAGSALGDISDYIKGFGYAVENK
jgi:hypothetical protein